MISQVRKIPILRYALIVALIVVLFVSAFYLYLYYRRAENVRYNVHQMILARESSAIIDDCLESLNSAENNSRLYAANADSKYISRFAADIKFVHSMIGQLETKKASAAFVQKIDKLGSNKALKSIDYPHIKFLADSLASSAARITRVVETTKPQPAKVTTPLRRTYTSVVHIDTIKAPAKPKAKPRKKFFARIFGSFSGKNNEEVDQVETPAAPTVVRRRIATRVESRNTVPTDDKKLAIETQQANLAALKLRSELFHQNTHLIALITVELRKYKAAEQHFIARGSDELDDSLQEVVFKFKRLSGLVFLFLIIIIGVILYNIWKIFRNEKDIIDYSINAEQYAQSKSAFLASMSHEIRTPLNSVIGFSEQLSQSSLNAIQTEQLNAISSSSRLLLDVVNEILDFSKFETGKMNFEHAPFKPRKILEDVFFSMRIQADHKGIRLEREFNIDDEVCLSGDAFRMKQVVINLLSNAIKFTSKGTVKIHAALADHPKGQKILNVSVTDTGVGISKENLPMIFGEFSQIVAAQEKASQRGTGLGLAISKKIVELQHGQINVTSEPGKGSVFSFCIPFDVVNEMACLQKEPLDHITRDEILRGRRILIAEDNKLNVLLLTTIMKKWKIWYDVAENGLEAFEHFELADYDLVLTDIEMPVMGGVEFARLIRKHPDPVKSGMPILALTANVLKEDRDRYLAAGINGMILKPFAERDLLDTITKALKNPLMDPQI